MICVKFHRTGYFEVSKHRCYSKSVPRCETWILQCYASRKDLYLDLVCQPSAFTLQKDISPSAQVKQKYLLSLLVLEGFQYLYCHVMVRVSGTIGSLFTLPYF